MSNWQSRHTARDDLPFMEPEKFRLNEGDRVYYLGTLWVIKHRGHKGFTPEKYCNDTNAFYILSRYDMGIIELTQFVTHADFGDGIGDAPIDKVSYCDAPIPSYPPKYSKSYLALIGK